MVMVSEALSEAQRMLRKNWLKATLFIFISYVILIFFGNHIFTLQMNDGSFSFSLFSGSTSTSIIRMIDPLGSFVSSIVLFAIIHYMYGLKTREKRYFSAFLYAFKNPRLLYIGMFMVMITMTLTRIIVIYFSIISNSISIRYSLNDRNSYPMCLSFYRI